MAIFTLLLTAIYKVLPDPAIPWRDLVLGAFVTAALFTIGTSASCSSESISVARLECTPWCGRRADRPHVPDGLSAQILLFGAGAHNSLRLRAGARPPPSPLGTIHPSVSSFSTRTR